MKKLTISFATSLFLLLTPICMLGQENVEKNIESNIIYGMHGGLALLMDVYRPSNPNGHGIIVIPGSGWHQPMSYNAVPLNQKGWYTDTILGVNVLLENGYTLFVINHRSAPVFRFPAPVEDVQRAVRFIRHNAEEFKINPDRIGAIGHSSGGHLVSMLGTMDDTKTQDNTNLIHQESSKVQAVVALAPATDLVKMASSSGDVGALSSFVGTHLATWRGNEAVQMELSLYAKASPITYVTSDDAPFLIVYGEEDSVVPSNQSEIFIEKLTKNGVAVNSVAIEGGSHSLATAKLGGVDTEAYYKELIACFDTYILKGE